MSLGTLFTLRPRGRKARPQSAGEPFPASAGWIERRTQAPAEPRPDTPRRRAGDRASRDTRAR